MMGDSVMLNVPIFAGLILLALVRTGEAFAGFALSSKPVSSLISENKEKIASFKEIATGISPDAPDDDVFYLRYCVASAEGDDEDIKSKLSENMKWRSGDGKRICDSARVAVDEAVSGGGWNNDPVRAKAPHAGAVNKYITSSNVVTTTSRPGDLVYCIRAWDINDVELMSEVSEEEMTDFFLYCKEVNALVANMRSAQTDRLVSVLTANDLNGVKLIGGDATFRKALSAASNKANDLYPALAGPTLLLNLPKLLGALVKLFTPLFPPEVRKKLRFERGPLSDVSDLTEILASGKRESFMDDLDRLIYSD